MTWPNAMGPHSMRAFILLRQTPASARFTRLHRMQGDMDQECGGQRTGAGTLPNERDELFIDCVPDTEVARGYEKVQCFPWRCRTSCHVPLALNIRLIAAISRPASFPRREPGRHSA